VAVSLAAGRPDGQSQRAERAQISSLDNFGDIDQSKFPWMINAVFGGVNLAGLAQPGQPSLKAKIK
jgi:hypothetical protein